MYSLGGKKKGREGERRGEEGRGKHLGPEIFVVYMNL